MDYNRELEEAVYWNENVPYGDGHADGVNGDPFRNDYPADRMKHYKQGFEMGRKRLRDNFQRMLKNDFGDVYNHS